jgi:hypothetical protein
VNENNLKATSITISNLSDRETIELNRTELETTSLQVKGGGAPPLPRGFLPSTTPSLTIDPNIQNAIQTQGANGIYGNSLVDFSTFLGAPDLSFANGNIG